MSQLVSLALLTEVFVTLFVIMDPVGTIPIFLSLTRGRSRGPVLE
jgi:multiple antibiotic resistance protein